MNVALAAIPFFLLYYSVLSFFFAQSYYKPCVVFSTESEAMHLCPVEAAY